MLITWNHTCTLELWASQLNAYVCQIIHTTNNNDIYLFFKTKYKINPKLLKTAKKTKIDIPTFFTYILKGSIEQIWSKTDKIKNGPFFSDLCTCYPKEQRFLFFSSAPSSLVSIPFPSHSYYSFSVSFAVYACLICIPEVFLFFTSNKPIIRLIKDG